MPPARPQHRALVIAALGVAVLASTHRHWDGLRRRLSRRRRALAAVTRAAGTQAAMEHADGTTGGGLAELSIALARPGPARDLAVEHLAGRATDDARALGDLIRAQRPPVLAERGLAGALGDLANWFADLHGLHCATRLALGGELGAELETAAYRAAESLLAAAAEGGAGRAELLVAGDGDQVVVELAARGELLSLTLLPATSVIDLGAAPVAGTPVEEGMA
jgi:hypothetical protein